MTLESEQDIRMLHSYIRKLQEIRVFLQRAKRSEGEAPKRQVKVNAYWA